MSNVNRMEKVLGELVQLTETANTDLANIPYQNRSGVAMAITDAKLRLATIEVEYKEMLHDRAFTLFVFGPAEEQAKFAAIAAAEGGAVVVSAGALYERLAQAVEPTLGAHRQFGGTALGHLIREIEAAARDSGTDRLTQVPRLRDVAIVKTVDDVAAACKEIVLQDTGTTLNKDYIEHLAFKQAFEQERSGKTIPVVVLGSGPSDGLEDLFSGRSIDVDVLEVDKEFVLNTFKRVREEVARAKKQ